jgi:hypothetical protein
MEIVEGNSEPCAGAVVAIGMALMLYKRFWAGLLILSIIPLERPNFLLLPFALAIVYRLPWRKILAITVVFFIPAGIWTIRNYVIFGEPILATNQGAAFYGTWNPVSTDLYSIESFAWWRHPDTLRGEVKLAKLAKTMTEPEVSRYYMKRATQFIAGHPWRISVVLAGHVLWTILPQSEAAMHLPWYWKFPEWICRLGLYLAALWFCIVKRPHWSTYNALLCCIGLTCLVTVILFFGVQRYLWPFTIMLVPFVSARVAAGREGENRTHDLLLP